MPRGARLARGKAVIAEQAAGLPRVEDNQLPDWVVVAAASPPTAAAASSATAPRLMAPDDFITIGSDSDSGSGSGSGSGDDSDSDSVLSATPDPGLAAARRTRALDEPDDDGSRYGVDQPPPRVCRFIDDQASQASDSASSHQSQGRHKRSLSPPSDHDHSDDLQALAELERQEERQVRQRCARSSAAS